MMDQLPLCSMWATPGIQPYFQLLNAHQQPIAEADLFLKEVCSRTNSTATLRTYGYALLDWYRFLGRHALELNDVQRKHVVQYILELKGKQNLQRVRRAGTPKAGSVNPVTGKRYLPNGYQMATVNLRISVITQFYDILILNDVGPTRHPVRMKGETSEYKSGVWGMRSSSSAAHLRQRNPQRLAHGLSKIVMQALRAEINNDRDAALIEGLYVSAARAEEMLALTFGDVNWQQQTLLLHTKGRQDKQEVAVSAHFLALLRTYLGRRIKTAAAHEPVWLMRREPREILTYSGLRAVLRRLNEKLSSNISAHDLRATCATHLAMDSSLSLLEIATHLRHAQVATTQRYLESGRSNRLGLHRHFNQVEPELPPPSTSYDPEVLARIFARKRSSR
ncbi:tyrosine-type recombinase/integrase [Deinococcus aquatilis]|uniref:tyrosine-type recombinase/integrase n=1 Tax=Deinococcus aquatilis TaxID=519440 RepID=UPI0003630D1F|nr:site-specific integrase [Deinococcus aquatilis]